MLKHATVLPLIADGVLNAPRIHAHRVDVGPQLFDANTHISQPELFPGIAPIVILTLLLAVVCGLDNPLIKQPAGADQL